MIFFYFLIRPDGFPELRSLPGAHSLGPGELRFSEYFLENQENGESLNLICLHFAFALEKILVLGVFSYRGGSRLSFEILENMNLNGG